MAPSTALHHVSQVLTCLVFQHAHFEENIAPPKLVPAVPIPEAVSVRVRRLFAEEVASELARLRRWLPSFADGTRGTWGDVADCLVSAIDALPEDATSARRRCEAFANQVLNDAVHSAEDGDLGNNRLERARVESRHARLLMDQGSHETVATLVAAGYVEPAATALLEVLRTTDVWETRLETLERASVWKWSGDGSVSAGKQACDAAVTVVRFVLDEMTKPATHGAQRRPLALALAMILTQIGRGGALPADIATLPVAELAKLGSAWSEKKNAAAENSALLQAVAALRRRVRVEDSEMDDEALEIDHAVHDALLSGLSAEKEESKESALECLADYLDSSRAPTRDLILRAVSVGGAKGPPPSLWGLVQRSLACAARADPGLALDVTAEMLKSTGALPPPPEPEPEPEEKPKARSSVFGSKPKAKAPPKAPPPPRAAGKPLTSVAGAGTARSRVVALRFLSWVLGTDAEDGDETDTPGQTGEGEGEANERAAVVAELRRRAPSLAAAVGVALRPPPPSGTWRGPGNVTYLTNRNPDAPEGEDVAVMLTALRCSPLLLDPRFSLAKTRDHAAEETNLLAVALAAACGNVEVEMAARAAIRRHAAHVSPAVLRRAVMHSLRAAESAVEGSADVAEWTCRLSTAAVTVAEAARRPTEDVFFDAAAVGPRAAAAVLLAAAHPSPDVHAAAAALLAAAEDLVDVAALSGDAMGHGADAGEDAETALASKLGGGLLRWLSSQASVGPETRDRAVSILGGWNDDPRVAAWRGGELSAASDAGVRRAVERLAASRVVEYAPAGDGSAHDLWRWHVAFFVAAARPAGHVPVRGGSLPAPGAGGAPGELSPSAVTPRKMLFAEDKPGAAADASEEDIDRTLNLEKQVGLGDGQSAFDAAAATRSVWARCAAAAEEGGRESFSPDAARSARRRGEALSDALVGAAPPCIASVVSVVAGDIVAAAAKTRETLKNVGSASVGAKEAKSLWPALARAACGLGLLRAVASRVVARRESDAAAFVDDVDTPERAAFEDALRLTWNASDAWLPALPGVAAQAYSSDYGDDGVLTDDDGVAAASRAAEAAAALAALRLRVAPPSTTAALDAATIALVHALPRVRGEWRAFANVVLEATNVVVVAAGAPSEKKPSETGDVRTSSCFGDGPPLTQSVADEAVARLAEASRVASRDVELRARARAERDAAETDAETRTEIEEDTPLAILAGARQAGALVTAACAELLARTPERAAAAAAASALQAAGAAIAAEEASGERRGGGGSGSGSAKDETKKTFLAPRAAPTRVLDAVTAALGAERGGLVAAAALVSMRLSPSLASSAAAHRALRAVAGAAAGPETTAAAAAAADAADAAASGEDLALAAEARRGAAAAATSAFVDPARPEAISRVETTAEGVFELAHALALVESLDVDENDVIAEEEPDEPEKDAAEAAARLGRRVWAAAAAAAEPAVAAQTRRCVAVSASAALETVHALALEVPAPATREVATALARAALEAAPRAHEDAAASFWLTLGAKIVGNLGLADDPEVSAHFEALETASDAAAAVVDALVEACAAEAAEDTLSPTGARRVSSLAALRFLRSEAGAAAAPRLVELVELVDGGDADAADARRASAAMHLVTSAMACPLASATFAPWLPSLAASATARRTTSPEAAALVAALRIAPVAADAAEVPAAVVREVSARFPRGRLAFRKALAENALRAAETAVAEGSADFDAVAAEAATRLFDAAVRGVQEESSSRNLVAPPSAPSVSAAKASARRRRTDADSRTPSRPFPTRALGAYALRLSRVFAGASGDARGVGVAVAAADAMASLAARYAEAGHMASASVDAAVVTRLCVAVSLAAIALPAPACVAAGVRLATAAGLTSSTRLTPGVAPAVVAALDGAAGASPPEAAAALFSRVLFLTPEAEEEEEDKEEEEDASEVSGETSSSRVGRVRPREPDARAGILDVACGVLSALPEDDGVAGSLDEFAILTCALLSWPSIGAAPDAAQSRASARMVTGLGVATLGPLAARFAALERGEYSSAPATEETRSASPGKREPPASPATRAHNRHNRRAFFRDACRAMGEAGCTSAQAWAQALRALAAAAAAAKSDPDARLAAADLLEAWLDARVHAEGKGAWETKALAAAASELVDMDDAALAPACSALASLDVTAEPAAVVDAVLLGDVTPHADHAESEDVKVRLTPWDPERTDDLAADGRKTGSSEERKEKSASEGYTNPNVREPRVRGVSVTSEDRLRRWARRWLADASAAAESLLAGNLRGRAGSERSASSAATKSGHLVGGERASTDSESDSDSDATRENDARKPTLDRFVLVGGVAKNTRDALTAGSGSAEPEAFFSARAPLALGEGWGDRTVDPLFAVLKSPATGGKRSASATLSPALAAASPSRVFSNETRPRWRAEKNKNATPKSLGGASPATSRRERRRARALGVPPGTPESVARAGEPASRDGEPDGSRGARRSSTNPFARRASPPPRDMDGDEGSAGSAFRLRRRDDDGGTATPFKGGLPPAPASESSVDDLVRGLGEMQAFEVDLLSEEAAVSPADPRRMRDADYKEASRRAKDISAARRAERQLASPTRARPGTPRAGPSA